MATSPTATPCPEACGQDHSNEAAALLTETQAAQRLSLSRSQLAGLRARRRISFSKRGGRVFYTPEEVERVLKAFEVPAIHPVVKLLKATAPALAMPHADTAR
jgi:hypothetical protein